MHQPPPIGLSSESHWLLLLLEQGDYLVELLQAALHHDHTYMGANMVYRRCECIALHGKLLTSFLNEVLNLLQILLPHHYLNPLSPSSRNRDRVITMGMELHEKAWALHHHRPEFTLTYPDLRPHPIPETDGVPKKEQVRIGACH